MELLAPVGNSDNFYAALEAGADAVYVGAPELNARNLARDLKLEEIGAMIRFCHARGKKLYVAANSLILEQELPKVLESLTLLETLEPDALIVQDLGLINLIHEYFPGLSFHASTLMLAHNADAVRTLAALGCSRVVLARELTVKEISAIARHTDVQLEVFIHGAMCFSYSGLCLFSSYLGGKSGLRGRCVQPCRRRYNWQTKGARKDKAKGGTYLFSMNDLSGLEVVPELTRIGIASLKIEGRLRSAHYVSHVVKAYRTVLDANDFEAALPEAKGLVQRAMGRTVASGYFFTPRPKDGISPYYSGNTGLHLGRMKSIGRQSETLSGVIRLKEPIAVGDRLRLHFEASGERLAFRLKGIQVEGRRVEHACAGSSAAILLPDNANTLKGGKVELYKIDVQPGNSTEPSLKTDAVKRELEKSRRKLANRIRTMQASVAPGDKGERESENIRRKARGLSPRRRGDSQSVFPEWWLKTDSSGLILGKLPLMPDRLVLTLDKKTAAQAGRIRQHLGRQAKKIIWALPPVLVGAEAGRIQHLVEPLIRSGFRSFQIGHLSQISLFGKERVHLFGDYTLNLMNDQAIRIAGRLGLEAVQVAVELDRVSLRNLLAGYRREYGRFEKKGQVSVPLPRPGLTVYGAPPLFTTRMAADHFNYDRVFVSPKHESLVIRKKESGTQTFSIRPFSLLPYLEELKDMGLGYVVIDLTGLSADKKGLQELVNRITGVGRMPKLPTFNYLGKLE